MAKRKGDSIKTDNSSQDFIDAKKLEDLYWKKNLSTLEIARFFGFRSRTSILNYMIKFGIPRKPSDRKNYVRIPFSGNLEEKAYLIGLRVGDIYAKRHGSLVLVSMTSTRKEQMKMFRDVFGPYSHITEREKKGGFTEKTKRADSLLHPSFEFLAEKQSSIPSWILNVRKLFFSFLAGYCDAEASWIVTEHKRYKGEWRDLVFSLGTCDKKILQQIHEKLKELGFNSHLYLVRKRGFHGSKTSNLDLYRVMIMKHNDVVQLGKILLPLSRHSNKKYAIRKILKYHDTTIRKASMKKQNLGTVEISCIYCGYKKVWENGFFKYKHKKYRRYKCPDCKREFSGRR